MKRKAQSRFKGLTIALGCQERRFIESDFIGTVHSQHAPRIEATHERIHPRASERNGALGLPIHLPKEVIDNQVVTPDGSTLDPFDGIGTHQLDATSPQAKKAPAQRDASWIDIDGRNLDPSMIAPE